MAAKPAPLRFLDIAPIPPKEDADRSEFPLRVTKPPLDILLCAPRGFCAGVVRAIECSWRR